MLRNSFDVDLVNSETKTTQREYEKTTEPASLILRDVQILK